jgi:hypothetical protein
MLKRPDYYRPGQVLCKRCGIEIAGMVGEGRKMRFVYHGLYREVKMLMDDGSRHVTNVCSKCAVGVDDVALLQALHDADMLQMTGAPESIKNRKVVQFLAATNRPVAME